MILVIFWYFFVIELNYFFFILFKYGNINVEINDNILSVFNRWFF